MIYTPHSNDKIARAKVTTDNTLLTLLTASIMSILCPPFQKGLHTVKHVLTRVSVICQQQIISL